jgi:hypothetical protein
MKRSAQRLTLVTSALLLAGTFGCDGTGPVEPPPPINVEQYEDIGRPIGQTGFLSADGYAGQNSPDDRSGEGEGEGEPAPEAGDLDAGAGSADGERSVEEGDIYRVMGNGLLANLNAYRGLQLLDVSNPDAPAIVGRLQISGSPVEMYIDDDKAYILMNSWYGYYGVRDDLASFGQLHGGVVASVDISDPTAPVLIDQAYVPGNILKSRLTKGNISAALYVAASRYDQWQNDDGDWSWETRTTVKSFDVHTGAIVGKTELDLGGYVTDIAATNRALMVARYDWSYDPVTDSYGGSRVSLIDITSPDGTMVEGSDVEVAGYVETQFNMDLTGDVLRVASGSWWGSTTTNHIQTFDASSFDNLSLIDEVTFGDGEQLFATLFLEDRAFAVTYLRVDPFHAFSIDAAGNVTEESEFIVSGWNEFFRPVIDDTRLIGIGVNDEEGRAMSVSLYDITDLTNPEPLTARADVEQAWGWSEALWDHRAFSVIEGAANSVGPNGEAETGLVLLPFSGWSDEVNGYTAAVQIFTFSADSLTKRGLMNHGTPVRRSFNVEDGLTGNLSEMELSLFGTTDPDAPAERGRVELAPDYADVLVFGDHAARVKQRASYWYWSYDDTDTLPTTVVDIIDRAAHPDTATAVASVEVPANAQLYQSGDALIAVSTVITDYDDYPYDYETTLLVYDLSDPTVPVLADELVTDRIVPSYGYYGYYDYPIGDCFDCGYGWRGYAPSPDVTAVPGGLAFLQRHYEQELLGVEHVCYEYPVYNEDCVEDDDGSYECTYIEGNRTCSSLDGAPELCTGDFRLCTYGYDGSDYTYACEPLGDVNVQTETYCYDNERYRYWQRFSVEVLDLRDTADVALADTVELPDDDEGVRFVPEGSNVWVSYKRPEAVVGSSLPYVRYFARKLDLSDPSTPIVSGGVNVPGELLAVDGDELFTRDYLWGEDIVETSINKVRLSGSLAYLEGIHRFDQQLVQSVVLDGAGHALVTHRLAWQFVEDYATDNVTHLSVLDSAGDLDLLSDVVVDSWATLKDGQAGRALFQVPGGLLVMNLSDATNPYAQAFFALRGWPSRIRTAGDDLLVPAGRYGVYRFDLDTFNLLPPL